MQFHGDNAIKFDITHLKMSKPKAKSQPTKNGKIDYEVASYSYNQGTVENPKTKPFVIELPAVECFGISQKYDKPTAGFSLTVDEKDHSDAIEVLDELYDFTIKEVFKNKSSFKKFSQAPSEESLKFIIKPVLRFQTDDDGTVTNENPAIFATMYTSGFNPVRFIGIDGKRIRWTSLKGVHFICIPTIKIMDFYVSSTANTIRAVLIKAVVMSIEDGSARDQEIISSHHVDVDDYVKQMRDLMSMTGDQNEVKEDTPFQHDSGMIKTDEPVQIADKPFNPQPDNPPDIDMEQYAAFLAFQKTKAKKDTKDEFEKFMGN
uniref:Uncharacterized protein n=1 Tax=Pithovirus LCPAC403 TaxID=2506596 RepID=A0A481ZBK4_9VIRU|nr:MAG: hypothetical protein LCPAC403_03010 [Pithovirus LCPAC403]